MGKFINIRDIIIYEDNHIIVINKPSNVLVQEDNTLDDDLISLLKIYLKEKYSKPGNVYLGLVHRLDRMTSGVMVFAKTSKAASRLSESIRKNEIKKSYYAVVCGVPDTSGKFCDYLSKDSKINLSFVTDKTMGKESILRYKLVDSKDNLSLVDIDLETGRSHQIRVQFAHRNFPLYGDHKYNKNATSNQDLALFSYKLTFNHPIKKEKMTFSLPLPKENPFNKFKI